MRMSRTWIVCGALAAGFLLGAGATPSAAERAGGERQSVSSTGVVEATDTKRSTVTIGGEVYAVGPKTRLLDEKGAEIPLKDVPVARVFRDEPRVDTDALVNFEATQTAQGWALETLQRVGELPR